MPTKKLLPSEQLINSIVDRDLWKEVGIAAAILGKTKREALDEALKLFLDKAAFEKAIQEYKGERSK